MQVARQIWKKLKVKMVFNIVVPCGILLNCPSAFVDFSRKILSVTCMGNWLGMFRILTALKKMLIWVCNLYYVLLVCFSDFVIILCEVEDLAYLIYCLNNGDLQRAALSTLYRYIEILSSCLTSGHQKHFGSILWQVGRWEFVALSLFLPSISA